MTRIVTLTAVITLLTVAACKHDPKSTPAPQAPPSAANDGNFPKEVAKIIIDKCATAGCHNAASYKGAGALLLDSWEHLFEGGSTGAAVVAYSSRYSSLMYYINVDSNLGPVATPTMPNNGVPLTAAEYKTIADWVDAGAPDKNGNIPFASDAATRQKIYLTQQTCEDVLTVIDAKTNLVMRYISIGAVPGIAEYPHNVKVTKDGKYAFIAFTEGDVVQKVDCNTDKVTGAIRVNSGQKKGQWNVLLPNEDGSKFVISDLTGHKLHLFEQGVESFSVNELQAAHGVAANRAFDEFYVSGQNGNIIYKVAKAGESYKKTAYSLNSDPPDPKDAPFAPKPHEILMAHDYSKYFATAQNTNKVIVMSAITHTPIKEIQVGRYPQEMAMSTKHPYLFVTCEEDASPFSLPQVTFKGSVYVINYNTLEVVKKIEGKFVQPHGIAVDDINGTFYFASKNESPNGVPSHHPSTCTGRNGFYNVYDINTFEPVGRRHEVLPNPYSADVRFK